MIGGAPHGRATRVVQDLLTVFAAGICAGAMNAAAGGGSFVTLPALVAVGIPSVAANASSTLALFPGAFASAYAYRHDFVGFRGMRMPAMLGVSLLGGLVGALLLLRTSQRGFDSLLPWLLLTAAVTFAFGRPLSRWLRRNVSHDRAELPVGPVLAAQFALGIYGGYFGGAVSIMMMAIWGLYGVTDVTAMNAAKSILVGSMNAVAALCFVVAGLIFWPPTFAMLAGAVAGGYAGARIARRVDPRYVRALIIVYSFAMTGIFFYRSFG